MTRLPAKRVMDLLISSILLALASPVLVLAMLAIWAQDFRSPFYVASRTGLNGHPFRMYKLRSMIIGADRTGVNSTSRSDTRITPVGRLIRKFKLDELPQLWNVLIGDMSLVGPRPNVAVETAKYTMCETRLLSVRPGVTDFASIVFSDEGEILADAADPDVVYNQLIRPGKSRLGLFYIENNNLATDIELIMLTAVSIASAKRAREGVANMLRRRGAPDSLVRLAMRSEPLAPEPPPGANEIVSFQVSAKER